MKNWIAGICVSAVVGLFGFLLIYPISILNPFFYQWLLISGDSAQTVLGYLFFNREPWHWPLGELHSYTYPEISSLVYTASTPIFSIVSKLLLGEGFNQFYGIFIFLSFIFQGLMGFALFYFNSKNWITSVLGAGFLVFLPAFLIRGYNGFSFTQHYGLLPHYLILASIFLVFHPRLQKNLIAWTLLMVAALGVHFYLAVTVILFFCAAIAPQIKDYRFRLGHLFVGAVLLLSFYAYGYLVIPVDRSLSWGFGMLSMNLNSWFNPMQKSSILPALPQFEMQYEGYQYLGMGLLLAFLFFFRRRSLTPLTPALKLVTLYLLFLSLSFNVTFFQWTLPERIASFIFTAAFAWVLFRARLHWLLSLVMAYFLVYTLHKAGPVLRASGRLAWGVEYLFIFLLFRQQLKPVWIAALFAIQLLDVVGGFSTLGRQNELFFKEANRKSLLSEINPVRYDRIVIVDDGNFPQWLELALDALKYDKKIGPQATARIDIAVRFGDQAARRAEVKALSLQKRIVYVLGSKDDVQVFINSCELDPKKCEMIESRPIGDYRYLIAKE